jgi:hypothetical protein
LVFQNHLFTLLPYFRTKCKARKIPALVTLSVKKSPFFLSLLLSREIIFFKSLFFKRAACLLASQLRDLRKWRRVQIVETFAFLDCMVRNNGATILFDVKKCRNIYFKSRIQKTPRASPPYIIHIMAKWEFVVVLRYFCSKFKNRLKIQF